MIQTRLFPQKTLNIKPQLKPNSYELIILRPESQVKYFKENQTANIDKTETNETLNQKILKRYDQKSSLFKYNNDLIPHFFEKLEKINNNNNEKGKVGIAKQTRKIGRRGKK
jgi:hypothetical protein